MKGLILAGGKGSRLRPITHTSAKQLVPVANKPILFYVLEDLVNAGIRDIGVIVGETAPEVRAALGDGAAWGAHLTFVDQPEPLGLADAVRVAGHFLGDDDFVMVLGDNLLEEGLGGLVDRYQRDLAEAGHPGGAAVPSARLLLKEVDDPRPFGVVEVIDGRVVRIEEKPSAPRSNLAMVGAYLFTARIHAAVAAIAPSLRGELEIADAIQWLVDQGDDVRHELVRGWWLDTGKKDSILEANRRVLARIESRIAGEIDGTSSVTGPVILEAGASLVRSTIVGPAVIGAGAIVEDSTIGPFTSIASGAAIVDSEVENSVLLEGVRLDGVPRLVDSLIGRFSHVTRSQDTPAATRLLIGDHCSVDLQ